MRLNAYYFGFDGTNVDAVDLVLSAVAWAGKAFHRTEDWHEPADGYCEPQHRGANPVERIANAAADAATLIKGQQAEIERLRRMLENAAACLEARSDVKARREWARSFREQAKP